MQMLGKFGSKAKLIFSAPPPPVPKTFPRHCIRLFPRNVNVEAWGIGV